MLKNFVPHTLTAASWIVKQFKHRPLQSIAVVAGIPLLVGIFAGDYGIGRRVELELENKRLKNAIEAEIKKQDSLKVVIKKLKTDKKYLEQLARSRYGMVKPGESLYKIQVEEEK